MSRLAKLTSICAAGCGRLVREGRDQCEMIVGSGDHPTAYVHPECVDAYEQLIRSRVAPVRNARISSEAQADFAEHVCCRCGADYAGRPGDATGTCACGGELVPVAPMPAPPLLVCERCGLNGTMEQRERGLPATCTKLGFMIKPSARRPGMASAGTCGGRLAPVGEDLPATTSEGGARPRSPEGTGVPARSRSGGQLRSLDPQLGLGGDSAGPAGEIEERGGARADRTAPSGEEADQ